jgi:hypothetical protein
MSKRIEKSWIVFASLENVSHERCVDIFCRPDSTFGFEEFRRDVEDAGEWTPVQFFSGRAFASCDDAYSAAERSVPWLAEILGSNPSLRKRPAYNPTESPPDVSAAEGTRNRAKT